MSEKKETIKRLSEQSASVAQKTLDRLEETGRDIAERFKRAREAAGLPPKRRNSHSDLPAVAR